MGPTFEHWMHIPAVSGDDAAVDTLDLVFAKRSFLHRHLRTHGLRGWQPATTAALLAAWELDERRTFFDIGANIGVYALLHQYHWRGHPSVAFEPTPALVEASRAMAEANGLDVRFEPLAVSDENGQATLYLSQRSDASNSLEAGFRRAAATLTVQTITLDDYVEQTGLVPGVVKIDVETHERAVLEGAHDVLARHRPPVVVELLSAGEADGGSQAVCDLLYRHGYRSRHLLPPPSLGLSAEPISLRDWLFWPGEIPAAFDQRYLAWSAAVTRCHPQLA